MLMHHSHLKWNNSGLSIASPSKKTEYKIKFYGELFIPDRVGNCHDNSDQKRRLINVGDLYIMKDSNSPFL